MNKLFVVLLAVCLVSVHAFVKRDAETPAPDANQGLKQLKEFAEQTGKQFQDFFDPENIKKTINEGIDNINKAFADLQSKSKDAKQ